MAKSSPPEYPAYPEQLPRLLTEDITFLDADLILHPENKVFHPKFFFEDYQEAFDQLWAAVRAETVPDSQLWPPPTVWQRWDTRMQIPPVHAPSSSGDAAKRLQWVSGMLSQQAMMINQFDQDASAIVQKMPLLSLQAREDVLSKYEVVQGEIERAQRNIAHYGTELTRRSMWDIDLMQAVHDNYFDALRLTNSTLDDMREFARMFPKIQPPSALKKISEPPDLPPAPDPEDPVWNFVADVTSDTDEKNQNIEFDGRGLIESGFTDWEDLIRHNKPYLIAMDPQTETDTVELPARKRAESPYGMAIRLVDIHDVPPNSMRAFVFNSNNTPYTGPGPHVKYYLYVPSPFIPPWQKPSHVALEFDTTQDGTPAGDAVAMRFTWTGDHPTRPYYHPYSPTLDP